MNRQTTDVAHYEIRVAGYLDPRWAARFDGLTVRQEANATTVVSGTVADQAALHGLLSLIRDLGLALISVERLQTPAARPADRTR